MFRRVAKRSWTHRVHIKLSKLLNNLEIVWTQIECSSEKPNRHSEWKTNHQPDFKNTHIHTHRDILAFLFKGERQGREYFKIWISIAFTNLFNECTNMSMTGIFFISSYFVAKCWQCIENVNLWSFLHICLCIRFTWTVTIVVHWLWCLWFNEMARFKRSVN